MKIQLEIVSFSLLSSYLDLSSFVELCNTRALFAWKIGKRDRVGRWKP
jgi:hypothetical protein